MFEWISLPLFQYGLKKLNFVWKDLKGECWEVQYNILWQQFPGAVTKIGRFQQNWARRLTQLSCNMITLSRECVTTDTLTLPPPFLNPNLIFSPKVLSEICFHDLHDMTWLVSHCPICHHWYDYSATTVSQPQFVRPHPFTPCALSSPCKVHWDNISSPTCPRQTQAQIQKQIQTQI